MLQRHVPCVCAVMHMRAAPMCSMCVQQCRRQGPVRPRPRGAAASSLPPQACGTQAVAEAAHLSRTLRARQLYCMTIASRMCSGLMLLMPVSLHSCTATSASAGCLVTWDGPRREAAASCMHVVRAQALETRGAVGAYVACDLEGLLHLSAEGDAVVRLQRLLTKSGADVLPGVLVCQAAVHVAPPGWALFLDQAEQDVLCGDLWCRR
jgi:hypothetical protein